MNEKQIDVRQLQQALTSLGFDAGPIDGKLGARTRASLVAFQKAAGLQPDGEIESRTLEALLAPVASGIGELWLHRDPANPFRRHLLADCIPPRPESAKGGKP